MPAGHGSDCYARVGAERLGGQSLSGRDDLVLLGGENEDRRLEASQVAKPAERWKVSSGETIFAEEPLGGLHEIRARQVDEIGVPSLELRLEDFIPHTLQCGGR